MKFVVCLPQSQCKSACKWSPFLSSSVWHQDRKSHADRADCVVLVRQTSILNLNDVCVYVSAIEEQRNSQIDLHLSKMQSVEWPKCAKELCIYVSASEKNLFIYANFLHIYRLLVCLAHTFHIHLSENLCTVQPTCWLYCRIDLHLGVKRNFNCIAIWAIYLNSFDVLHV